MRRVLLAASAALTLGMTPATLSVAQGCDGCFGAGGGGSASGGTCGGMIDITVTVADGKCKWAAVDSAFLFHCKQISGCETSVTRSWQGLPPNVPLDFCVDPGVGQLFCLQDPPTSGSGSGSDARDSLTMQCKNGSYQWTMSAGCGLAASALGTCSRCVGDI